MDFSLVLPISIADLVLANRSMYFRVGWQRRGVAHQSNSLAVTVTNLRISEGHQRLPDQVRTRSEK